MSKIQGELLRGNIDTIILKCLFEGDKYGNEICKAVEERTLGQFEIKQPTLYSCLTRLENQGLVTCTWVNTNNGGRRKYFSMTPAGQDFFAQKQKEWEYSRTVVDKLISEQIFDLSQAGVQYRPKEEETEQGKEISAQTVVPEEKREASAISVAEQEIAASVIEPERPTAVSTEESVPPKEMLSSATAAKVGDDVTEKLNRAIAGTSYFDQLSEQTYVPPPKASAENYFRFADEEEEEESEEVASEILTRAPLQQTEREIAAQAGASVGEGPRETLRRTETPIKEPLSPEECARRENARNVLYADAGDAFDNLQNVSAQQNESNRGAHPQFVPLTDNEPEAPSEDYKATLAALFAVPEPASAPEAPVTDAPAPVPKEKLANGLTLRRHNRDLTREYNEKYYVFGNRLRFWQSVILAVVMLAETLVCYLAIGVGANVKTDAWLYYVAAILSVVYPIYSAGAYFIKPLQIQRIDEEKKNNLLYKLILTLQAIVLIVCIDILVDKNVLSNIEYLSRIVLPIVLSTNIVLNALIGQTLIKTRRFAVK